MFFRALPCDVHLICSKAGAKRTKSEFRNIGKSLFFLVAGKIGSEETAVFLTNFLNKITFLMREKFKFYKKKVNSYIPYRNILCDVRQFIFNKSAPQRL